MRTLALYLILSATYLDHVKSAEAGMRDYRNKAWFEILLNFDNGA